MEFSLYDYDEFIKKHCGRLSLLNQAKTGYKTKGEFEEAYRDLYTNPKVQRDFGVEALAYISTTSQGVFDHLMTDARVSEGEARFTPSFEPEIEGGVFVRDSSLFDKDGKFDPPPVDDTGGFVPMSKYKELEQRADITARALVERENQEAARRIAERTTASELNDYYDKRIGMSNLGSARKEARERQGFKYSATEFRNLTDKEEKIEYLVDRFFGNDATAFVNWQESERQTRGQRPTRFELPEPRKDLFATEFAPMPPQEPAPTEPASPRVGANVASGSGGLSAEEREMIDEMAASFQ